MFISLFLWVVDVLSAILSLFFWKEYAEISEQFDSMLVSVLLMDFYSIFQIFGSETSGLSFLVQYRRDHILLLIFFLVEPRTSYQSAPVLFTHSNVCNVWLPICIFGAHELCCRVFRFENTVENQQLSIIWTKCGLFSVSLSGFIHCLDLETGSVVKTLKGHNKPITALTVSADKSTAFTADFEGNISKCCRC